MPQEGKKGHTEAQMVAVLRQVADIWRRVGISQATFYHCRHGTLEGGGMQKKSARVGRFSVPDFIDLDRADRTDHPIDRSAAPCNARPHRT